MNLQICMIGIGNKEEWLVTLAWIHLHGWESDA